MRKDGKKLMVIFTPSKNSLTASDQLMGSTFISSGQMEAKTFISVIKKYKNSCSILLLVITNAHLEYIMVNVEAVMCFLFKINK